MLLEFENKEKMQVTVSECGDFLGQKLTDVRPSTMLSFGVAHLVWIRLWQVPLGLWIESFFTSVGNRMWSYVLSDNKTLSRHRADYARILVRMRHPLLHCFTMLVDVGETSCIVLIEEDVVSYDYSSADGMPSTPVKIYNSEDEDTFNFGRK